MKLSQLLSLIQQIAEEKGISEPMICGGLPRDKILNRTSDFNDIDLTTGDQGIHYLAKELAIKLKLNKSQYFVMPDGHAKLMIGGVKVDFSSNFNIPNIDEILKQQGVANVDDMQRELYSRDFTCNALLMSMNLKQIFDPIGKGISDIKDKMICTCLSPKITLGYDNKRIARILYLAAKLDFGVDPDIIKWVKANPSSLSNVPQQYLIKKLIKATTYNIETVVKLLTELDLWKFVPPIEPLKPYILRNTKRL